MGLISDLATLVGAGAKWDDVMSLAKLEKGGQSDVPEQKDFGKTEETKSDASNTETPPETGKQEPTDEKSTPSLDDVLKRLEDTEKALAESQAKVEKLQKANQNRNLDDGLHLSDEDMLNNIMMDMY